MCRTARTAWPFRRRGTSLDKLGHIPAHVVHARRPRRHELPREHIEGLEVELHGVDARARVRIAHRNVPERPGRLLPVLGLKVDPSTSKLDLDVLLVGLLVARRRFGMANEAVEGREHAFLLVGKILGGEQAGLGHVTRADPACILGDAAAFLSTLALYGVEVLGAD